MQQSYSHITHFIDISKTYNIYNKGNKTKHEDRTFGQLRMPCETITNYVIEMEKHLILNILEFQF